MITFTETDTNLPAIIREGKLFNLITTLKYHIYGLRQKNNSAVLIEYEHRYMNYAFRKRLDDLLVFFKLNEIEVEVENNSGNRTVDIGLRIDVRKILNRQKKPVFAASLLSTIIYCLEDRVDIEQMKQYKLSCLPKLSKKNEEVIESRPGQMCEYGWWNEEIETDIKKLMAMDASLTRSLAIVKLFEIRNKHD